MGRFKKDKAVTLVALIITIIVLLILAGVAFNVLTGSNGILARVSLAREIAKQKTAREKLGFMLEEYIIKQNEQEQTEIDPLYNFFDDKLQKGEISGIKNNDTEIITKLDGYEFIIDKETLKITGENESEPGPELEKGEVPEFNITVSDINAEGTEKVLTVNITNIASYGSNYIIEIKHIDEIVPEEISLVGNGQKSYKITVRGDYTVTVKGTKEGVEKSAVKIQNVEIARVTTATQFNKANGVIDIIWLDANNNKIDTPEAPVLRRINSSKMDRNNRKYNNRRRYRMV